MSSKGGIVSAGGFQGLENTALARIGYHNKFIAKGWEKEFIDKIVNSEIDERILRCNQMVQFVRQPDVGPWRDYEKNQELVPDLIAPEAFCMRICVAKYKAFKFDKYDLHQICDRFSAFEEAFLDSTYQQLASEWRNYILCGMALEAAKTNRGCTAGKFGRVNLGCINAPIKINGNNIGSELSKLQRVLQEAHRWEEGKMFLVISHAIKQQFYDSQYASALQMGACVDCSMLMTGQIPGMVMGFNVFETASICSTIDPKAGCEAYFVIAGHQDAFAFAGDMVEGELVRPSRYFGIEYQLLAAWGAKAIIPDALAVGYWTVD